MGEGCRAGEGCIASYGGRGVCIVNKCVPTYFAEPHNYSTYNQRRYGEEPP